MAVWFDRVFALGKIISSILGKDSGGVLVNVEVSAEADEGSTAEPLGGAFVFRPLDEDEHGAAEVMAARSTDGLRPLWTRDLRLTKARGAVAKGTLTIPHYGKGFVSLDLDGFGDWAIFTVYVPYGRPPPTVSKAHVFQMDPTSGDEHVKLVHGSGHGLLLTEGGAAILKNSTGDAYISIDPNGVKINGQIKASTSLVGGDIATAQNVALGPPTIAAINALIACVGQIAAVLNAPGTVVGAPGLVTLIPSPLTAATASSSAVKASL